MQTPQGPSLRAIASWRLRCRLRADRPVILIEQGNAEVEQYLVDGRLVLLDQTVEQPFPVLVGRPDAHADAIDEPGSRGFLDKRRDMERRGWVSGGKNHPRAPPGC